MTADTVARWNLVVSRKTDTALRQFLASEGGGRKGDLSRFVEQAVQAQIFQLAAARAKANNADIAPEEMDAAIEEALDWAHSR